MSKSTFGKKIVDPKMTSMMVDPPPVWIAGRGTPDGAIEPWKSATKGSLYSQTNATDDEGHLYVKIANAGADADWDLLPIAGHTH